MIRHRFLGFLLLIGGGLLLTSCHKEYFKTDRLSDEVEIEPGIVAPLIYGSMTMENIAEVIDPSDYTVVEEDGLTYYLVYGDTIYSVDETVEFDLDESGIESDMVEQVRLKMKTVNELPLEVRIQVYMEDEFNVVLHTLFDNDGIILGPAVVDSDGNLIEATENENTSTFDASTIEILDDIAYIRVSMRMVTAKNDEIFVKIYSEYALFFDISLSAELRLNNRDIN